jgi:IS30 family transposase
MGAGRVALPRERQDAFWKVHARGVRIRDAAEEAGVDYETAREWVARAGGIRPRRQQPSGRFLSLAEREEITVGLAAGTSIRAIARELGRSPSTVSREIARNRQRGGSTTGSAQGSYRAVLAQGKAESRARRPKLRKLAGDAQLADWVQEHLRKRWSPRQISERIRVAFPHDERMRISHEAIYQSLFVQGRGGLRKELTASLRSGRAIRQPRRKLGDRRGSIPGMVLISERPAEVEDRAVPGHWEGDLIIGKNGKSAIGTLVERTTRYVLLLPLPGPHDARAVADAIITAIGTLPVELRRSLTWDQGRELSKHASITMATDMQVYFCDPHSPWQRGSNENTNGLLRQYFPKGTDLSVHSPEHLAAVAIELNGRPRQTLGWKTPAEALEELLASAA